MTCTTHMYIPTLRNDNNTNTVNSTKIVKILSSALHWLCWDYNTVTQLMPLIITFLVGGYIAVNCLADSYKHQFRAIKSMGSWQWQNARGRKGRDSKLITMNWSTKQKNNTTMDGKNHVQKTEDFIQNNRNSWLLVCTELQQSEVIL